MKKIVQIIFSLFLLITLTGEVSAQKKWVGTAGDGLWNSASNWSGGIVPTSSDSVLFDNSTVSGNYSVNLPTGSDTTASVYVQKLRITPTPGSTITLTLPSTNTFGPTAASAALWVGDAAATITYDIILDSGAVLVNSSGASNGRGISLRNPTSDKMLISNGGMYIHNTLRPDGGTSANATSLAYVAGLTERGTFKYQLPRTTTFNLNLGNRAFGGNVIIDRDSAATVTIPAVNSVCNIYGNLTVGSNVTISPTAGSSTIQVWQDATINGTVSLTNTGGLKFNSGTSGFIQTLSGSGTLSVTALNKQSNPTLKLNMDVTVTGTTTINGKLDCGTSTIKGAGAVNAGSGNPTLATASATGVNGALSGSGTKTLGTTMGFIFNGTAAQVTGSIMPATIGSLLISDTAGVTLSQATTAATVTVNTGAKLITPYTLTASTSASISGSFQLNSGGWATGGTWTYGAAGTLIFNSSTNYGVNSGDVYWPSTSGPANVNILQGGVTLNSGAARTVTGVIQTAAGIINAYNLTINGTMKINGGGYLDSAPAYGSASTLIYNTGGTYGRYSEWNTSQPTNVQISGSTTLNYPNAGTSAETLNGNLTIDNGSALYMDYGSPNPGVGLLTVNGNVSLNGSLSLGNLPGGDLKIGGNFTRTGSLQPNGRSVEFGGSNPQTITGATGFDYLNINNGTGVTLASDIWVNQDLVLTSGLLKLGTHNLTLSGGVSGTPSSSRMVVATGTGVFRKIMTGAAPHSFTFPVGDSTSTANYTPVAYALNSGSFTADTIDVKLAPSKHSQNTASTDYLNRYWTITGSGVTSRNYSATFTYVSADVVGTESNLSGALWDGSTWNNLGTVNTGTHTISATNQSAFGAISAMAMATSGHIIVKVIPQGFYNEGGFLNGIDSVRVLLANVNTPYAFVDSTDTVLDSLAFQADAEFATAASGTYYVVIKHRNSIETWSAAGVVYTKGASTNYDFTSAASQAYGNNETAVASGVYAIYGGDCNQDGYVDPLDLSLVDQDSYNYVSGKYLATDVNGDGYVDPLDLSIVDQNSFNYVGIQRPTSGRIISAQERAKTLPYYANPIQVKKNQIVPIQK